MSGMTDLELYGKMNQGQDKEMVASGTLFLNRILAIPELEYVWFEPDGMVLYEYYFGT